MPVLSVFYGIIVRMFYSDHNPPHVHTSYQDEEAIFDFEGDIVEGELPAKQKALVKAWILLHADELVAAWRLASDNERVDRIDPLR